MKPKCPECGSANVLYRLITKESWCRRCGCSWKTKPKKRG